MHSRAFFLTVEIVSPLFDSLSLSLALAISILVSGAASEKSKGNKISSCKRKPVGNGGKILTAVQHCSKEGKRTSLQKRPCLVNEALFCPLSGVPATSRASSPCLCRISFAAMADELGQVEEEKQEEDKKGGHCRAFFRFSASDFELALLRHCFSYVVVRYIERQT